MTVCRSPQEDGSREAIRPIRATSSKDAPKPLSRSAPASVVNSQSTKPLDIFVKADLKGSDCQGDGGSPIKAAGQSDESQTTLSKGRSTDKLDNSETMSVASGFSAKSSTSSIGSEFINDKIPAHQRDIARIQSQMKTFVKGMVRGREMNVLSVDGQLRTCTCSFDRKLRSYNIVINKETRSIPLSKFKEVFQGTEPDDIATPLDELCATFVLDSGECLSFRFKDVQERESFAICLQIIVDGHQ